jgi:hypothetical protein
LIVDQSIHGIEHFKARGCDPHTRSRAGKTASSFCLLLIETRLPELVLIGVHIHGAFDHESSSSGPGRAQDCASALPTAHGLAYSRALHQGRPFAARCSPMPALTTWLIASVDWAAIFMATNPFDTVENTFAMVEL